MSNPENQQGVIFDQGYRHYDGRYLGRAYSVASLAWDDAKRALGFKRKTGYRIGIILLIFFELGIAGFFLFSSEGLGQFLSQQGSVSPVFLNVFSIFLEFSSIFALIFAAMVAPGLLCRDRKNKVFPLYIVRPIYPLDYLLAKALSIFAVISFYVLGPALLLFVGKTFLAANAVQYLLDNQSVLGALVLSGALIALFYSSYSMAVSSLTTGVGIAAGLTIGLIFLFNAVSGISYLINNDPWVTVIDFGDAVYRIKDWIFFGQLPSIEAATQNGQSMRIEALPLWVYFAVTGLIIIGSWLITLLAYRREVQQ